MAFDVRALRRRERAVDIDFKSRLVLRPILPVELDFRGRQARSRRPSWRRKRRYCVRFGGIGGIFADPFPANLIVILFPVLARVVLMSRRRANEDLEERVRSPGFLPLDIERVIDLPVYPCKVDPFCRNGRCDEAGRGGDGHLDYLAEGDGPFPPAGNLGFQEVLACELHPERVSVRG